MDDESRTEIVEAKLEGGQTIRIQATSLGGQERVGMALPSFKEVTDAVEGIAQSVLASLAKVKPRKGAKNISLLLRLRSRRPSGMYAIPATT